MVELTDAIKVDGLLGGGGWRRKDGWKMKLLFSGVAMGTWMWMWVLMKGDERSGKGDGEFGS